MDIRPERARCRAWASRPFPLSRFGISTLAIVALAGCHSMRPPETSTETLASTAAGLSKPIAFQVEGAPIDEPSDPETLTFTEAVRESVTTDPAVQAALARVRIALADSKQARLLPNPILNFALRFPEGGGKPVIEASLAQDLISILKIPRQSSAADNRLRQASAAAIIVVIDVVAEVQERYVSAQALEQLLPVLEQRRTLVSKAVDLANARLSAGEGTREDVAVLDTQRVNLNVEIAETTQELRDERLPRLLPFDGTSAGAQAQRDPDWQVGPEVSIPIPIFDMGQARSERVTAAQIEARHELVQTKRQIIEDVRRSWESLIQTRENVRRVRQELVPLQEQRRSLADASFRAGQTDVTSLFLAEQDLRAAQAKAVELERKAAIAAIRLQRAVGGPGPSAALTITSTNEAPVPNPVK